MAGDAARWIQKRGLFARTVVIKVRYGDFTTITRSHSEAKPTRDDERIAARAVALLDKTEAGRRPVRLLGVSLHNLEESDDIRTRRAGSAADPSLPL
jgi:DNA polymerase-4